MCGGPAVDAVLTSAANRRQKEPSVSGPWSSSAWNEIHCRHVHANVTLCVTALFIREVGPASRLLIARSPYPGQGRIASPLCVHL
jgi:hypothetical protein